MQVKAMLSKRVTVPVKPKCLAALTATRLNKQFPKLVKSKGLVAFNAARLPCTPTQMMSKCFDDGDVLLLQPWDLRESDDDDGRDTNKSSLASHVVSPSLSLRPRPPSRDRAEIPKIMEIWVGLLFAAVVATDTATDQSKLHHARTSAFGRKAQPSIILSLAARTQSPALAMVTTRCDSSCFSRAA